MSAVISSPYKLLEPTMWRSLLARAAVFHAARGTLARLCDVAEQLDSVRLVLLELDLVARELSDQDCDDVTVVALVVRKWEAMIDSTLQRGHVEPEAQLLLRDLQTRVRFATGDDPFRVIFQGIQAQAEALYGASWRSTRLSVAHTRSHPRGADLRRDPYAVTAITAWLHDPEQAEVELRIFSDKFGPAAFAVLPMLLTHEFVCHVPARQERAKNDSEFAEGFLDWAAYYFLHVWAAKVDPQLAPAARQHADRLKYVLADSSGSPEVRARQMGHEAAENLVVWFEQECRLPPEESRTRVALLAVQLNKIERPLDSKDHFVSLLSWSVPPQLAEVLRSWVSGTTRPELLLDVA